MTEEEDNALRHQVKAELRKRMRSVRKAIPADARAKRSVSICEQLVALPEFATAKTVSAYLALTNEIDVLHVINAAHAAGKRIVLPRVDPEPNVLVLHAYKPGDPLEPSPFGVREPLATAQVVSPSEVDLMIVPGLAFDEQGHRIGYGAGYYDRLLPQCTRALKVGIAFDFQRIAEVPVTDGDVPVDLVVTDVRAT